MIRVLIVDDQLVTRRGLKVVLEGYDDIKVVGEADSGPTAVQAAHDLTPDVVLMDIRMPDGDGISATRAISNGADPVPVIAITTFDLDEYVFGALESGAAGFLLKSVEPDALANAIRVAARGDGLVAPEVTLRVLAEFAALRRPNTTTEHPNIGGLTPRELEIVQAVARGSTNPEIALELGMESGTVKNHVSNIISSLGLRNRVQLATWAFRRGLAS